MLPLHNPAKRKSYYTKKTGVVKNFFPAPHTLFPCGVRGEKSGETRSVSRDDAGRGEGGSFDREQTHAVHTGNFFQRGDKRADAA